MIPGKGGRLTKRQEERQRAKQRKLLRAAGVAPEAAAVVVESRGALDAAAVDAALAKHGDETAGAAAQQATPPGPAQLPDGEPSPEELQSAGYYYKAVFDILALVLNVPELRVTDGYMDSMNVRRPAALVIRKRFPHGAEPETQLLVASGPHLLKGAQVYADRKAEALRALAARGDGRTHATRPGPVPFRAADNGQQHRAPGGEPARVGEEGLGQDIIYETITPPITPAS